MQIVEIRHTLPRDPSRDEGRDERKYSVTLHYFGVRVPDARIATQDAMIALLCDTAAYHMRPGGFSPAGGGGLMYHYVIGSDGTVYHTRDVADILWHCGNQTGNMHSIAVNLPRGPGQSPTPSQWGAFIALVRELGFERRDVYGHREWPRHDGPPQPHVWHAGQSTCPGSVLMDLLHKYRTEAAVTDWHREGEHVESYDPPRTLRVLDYISPNPVWNVAVVREGPGRQYPVAWDGNARYQPGASVDVRALVLGEHAKDVWAWLADGSGFMHTSLLVGV